MDPQRRGKLGAALDPRRRIYRDSFNEYVVFLISATGAAILAPVILLVVGAFTGHFELVVFVAAAVLIELFLIFGLGRPQMKPRERLGWALLWSAAAAFFALCFYYLVFDRLI